MLNNVCIRQTAAFYNLLRHSKCAFVDIWILANDTIELFVIFNVPNTRVKVWRK